MHAIFEKARNIPFSVKSFLIGLAGVLAVYVLLFGYIALTSSSTIEALEHDLSSYSTVIRRSEAPPQKKEKKKEQVSEYENIADVLSVHSKAQSLSPAPVAGFYEDSEYGKLPIISDKTGSTPFTIYKKPASLNRDKKTLAVLILDYGLSDTLSQKILSALPSSISLLLSPYSGDVDEWRKRARADGHEIWLHMPVETGNFPKRDPGPKALMSDVSLAYNQERLGWNLGRTVGYAGVAAYTDYTLQSAAPMFTGLIRSMLKRGLGYIELNPEGGTFVKKLAYKEKAPFVRGDETLKIFKNENKRLQALEQHILSHSQSMIFVEPAPKTLSALVSWIEKMEKKGVMLVPASAIASVPKKDDHK